MVRRLNSEINAIPNIYDTGARKKTGRHMIAKILPSFDPRRFMGAKKTRPAGLVLLLRRTRP